MASRRMPTSTTPATVLPTMAAMLGPFTHSKAGRHTHRGVRPAPSLCGVGAPLLALSDR